MEYFQTLRERHDLQYKDRLLNLKKKRNTSIYGRKHPTPEHTNSTAAKAIFHREDLILREVDDRLIPVITTMKMTSYALYSTPTTPHTGPGHDLQHTDSDTPCSSKHIEDPCYLQHIDYSTICSGHAPLEQMAHISYRATCSQGHVPIKATCPTRLRASIRAMCSLGQVPIRLRAHLGSVPPPIHDLRTA